MAGDESSQSYLQLIVALPMSDDFWAGWISGALGIIVGNSLDRKKVLLQAQPPSRPLPPKPTLSRSQQSSPPSVFSSLRSPGTSPPLSSPIIRYFQAKSPLAGVAAPSLGYGALNGILFVTYSRTEDALNRALLPSTSPDYAVSSPNVVCSTTGSNLWTTWFAGAVGGLATWVVSTPTELVKCQAQLASATGTHASNQPPSPTSSGTTPLSSWHIAKTIFRTEGIFGLYRGGVVTALRDSIGYGFYFWSFALGDRIMTSFLTQKSGYVSPSLDAGGTDSNGNSASSEASLIQEAIKFVLCGGVAGVMSWASIFPLDFVKTRVQVQHSPAATPPLRSSIPKRKGAIQITKELYTAGGSPAFFRGLTTCTVRAFFVNAFQWPVYKGVMFWLSQSNHDREESRHT